MAATSNGIRGYLARAFRWQRGRQGTAYDKMLLLTAPWPLPFDTYLIRYPDGSEIPLHMDPTGSGRHYRLNIILKSPESGGELVGCSARTRGRGLLGTSIHAEPPTRSPQRNEGSRVDDVPHTAPRRMLRCAGCGSAVTDDAQRIDVSGAHRHIFVNPEGHVFEIGCFALADGVRPIGPAREFFSWFPGYPWRVVICRACNVHLGWSYGEPSAFVGLILTRLVEDG